MIRPKLIDPCPNCHRPPMWSVQKLAHNSRPIITVACTRKEGCTVLAQGVTEGAACMNWNREVLEKRNYMNGVLR